MNMIQISKNKKEAYQNFLNTGLAYDHGLLIEDSFALRATIDEISGFLHAPVKLARVGVQHYYGFELGLKDRALEKIGVYRSPEEVFSPDSIKSFVNLPLTDDHPTTAVTVDNVKKLQVGSVSEVKSNDDGLFGIMTATDPAEIKKIQDGKKEVSVGYGYELVPMVGSFKGQDYEFAQTKIRANHLAIVDAGRCGPACRINMDSKKEIQKVKITINGIDYEVEDAQLAQAIKNDQLANDAEKEEFKKKLSKAELEKEKMEEDKDKAEAAKDAMSKTIMNDEAIEALVSDRAELLTNARLVLGDKVPECNNCPREIQAAVADAILKVGDVSKKSDTYVEAMYDLAMKNFNGSKKSMDNLGKDFKEGQDKVEVTRESVRDKYATDTLSN